MSKSRNNLSGRVGQGSRVRATRNRSSSFAPTNIVAQSPGLDTEKAVQVGALGDEARTPLNAKVTSSGISFGSPSSSASNTSNSSGSEWGNLLKQTTSGGISSFFTGTFGSVGGIGCLISGIVGLFGGGGKSTPPPLVRFQRPTSQQQTVYVNSESTAVYQGSVVDSSTSSRMNTGIYSTSAPMSNTEYASNGEWLQQQSAQIAQAVKNAILNSSSLNDVIAEI